MLLDSRKVIITTTQRKKNCKKIFLQRHLPKGVVGTLAYCGISFMIRQSKKTLFSFDNGTSFFSYVFFNLFSLQKGWKTTKDIIFIEYLGNWCTFSKADKTVISSQNRSSGSTYLPDTMKVDKTIILYMTLTFLSSEYVVL